MIGGTVGTGHSSQCGIHSHEMAKAPNAYERTAVVLRGKLRQPLAAARHGDG